VADARPKPKTPRLAGGHRPRQALAGVPGYLAEDVDRLVHERVRLGILSALAVNQSVLFTELKELLKTSDGNLSVHARKLEDAGYVSCSKSFEGRQPCTRYQLTPRGRKALERYLDHMEAVIRTMREA
jgi:DNA-binding MarR family transcriptional regulator